MAAIDTILLRKALTASVHQLSVRREMKNARLENDGANEWASGV